MKTKIPDAFFIDIYKKTMLAPRPDDMFERISRFTNILPMLLSNAPVTAVSYINFIENLPKYFPDEHDTNRIIYFCYLLCTPTIDKHHLDRLYDSIARSEYLHKFDRTIYAAHILSIGLALSAPDLDPLPTIRPTDLDFRPSIELDILKKCYFENHADRARRIEEERKKEEEEGKPIL